MEIPASDRRYILAAIALCAMMIAGGIVYTFAGHSIAQSLVESGWAARLDSTRDVDATHWQHRLRAMLVRVTLAELAVVVVLLAWVSRHRDWALTRYFAEQDPPLQLAATRIIVFAIVLMVVLQSQPLNYVDLPGDLTKAPFPFESLLRGFSFPGTFTTVVLVVLVAAAICGLLGLFTRTAALVVALAGVYVLGIPQSFGKVNHYHIAIWLPAVLAMSRAGDFLSLDAIWRARRAARSGMVLSLSATRVYALPTRLIWLLLGMIYCFPGFYKIFGGPHDHVLEWAFSDSLRNAMSHQWYLKGLDPLFRIDHVPWLPQIAALMVVAWEFLWPVVVLLPCMRVPLAISTILFHSLTNLLMGIAFWNLRMAMLLLFPWSRIARRIGSWVFGQPMTLEYDRHDARQLAVVNLLAAFNIFEQLQLRASDRMPAAGSDGLSFFGLAATTADPRQTHDALRSALYRRMGIPVPLVPRVLCDVGMRQFLRSLPTYCHESANMRPATTSAPRGLLAVAGTIAAINLSLAVLHMHRAWPFALFPSFEVVTREHRLVDVQIGLVDAQGRETVFDRMKVKRVTRMSIWWEMTNRLLENVSPSVREDRFESVWNFLCRHQLVDADAYTEVRFYRVKVDTLPEFRGRPPLEKSLIGSLSGAGLVSESPQPAELPALEVDRI